MPIWPFRSQRPADGPEKIVDRSPLGAITDETPHRFRIWVARGDAARALATLAHALGKELTATAGEPDERGIPIELASTFSPRTAAIARPLHALERAGVPVIGFEMLDLLTDLDVATLAAAVEAWGRFANTGPHRHRLEVLAGEQLLDRCLAALEDASADPRSRGAWRFAATRVAANTDGAEPTMLSAALTTGWNDASAYLDAVIERAEIARLTGSRFSVPDEPLAALIRRRDYASERASYLAQQLPAPLPDAVTDALCEVAVRGGDAGERATAALANAAPTERVRETLQGVLASDEPGPMAAALGTLARHWPGEARPVWRRFLESRSVPLRWAAEQTLGDHGSEEDVPEAAAHLAKLVRTKSSAHMTPPRGAEIVALLVRHAEQPSARAALDDLSARWDRLGDDMREWVEAHHPELRPDGRSGTPVELGGVEPEEPLTWPAPALERDGDAWMVTFDEGAHHSPQRERFEELAAASPVVEVLDGDREWLRVRIDANDADAGRLVRELWEASLDR
jgi:hypothetical protein